MQGYRHGAICDNDIPVLTLRRNPRHGGNYYLSGIQRLAVDDSFDLHYNNAVKRAKASGESNRRLREADRTDAAATVRLGRCADQPAR